MARGQDGVGLTRREWLTGSAALVGAAALGAGARESAAQDDAQPRIKQSFTWGTYGRDIEPATLIREAKTVGFQSIEMGPRQHWQAIKDAGMTVAIFGGGGGFVEPDRHDRLEQQLSAAIDTAVEYGLKTILCLSGNRKGRGDEELFENSVKLLKRVMPKAEDSAVVVAPELLNSKVNHPDYWLDHTHLGVELCKRVDSRNIKLLYDIYHMQIMEGDLIRTIRSNIDYIAHFHCAGNPGRRDMDDQQEIYYPAVARAIADAGYQGYIGHELTPKGDPLEAMRANFKVLDV
ncbi:MAG: hydroxypyruvate isomerase family protein [Armatimonadota bacterium]